MSLMAPVPTSTVPPLLRLASVTPPVPTGTPQQLKPVIPLLLVGCASLTLVVALHVFLYYTNRRIRAEAGARLKARIAAPRLSTAAQELEDMSSLLGAAARAETPSSARASPSRLGAPSPSSFGTNSPAPSLRPLLLPARLASNAARNSTATMNMAGIGSTGRAGPSVHWPRKSEAMVPPSMDFACVGPLAFERGRYVPLPSDEENAVGREGKPSRAELSTQQGSHACSRPGLVTDVAKLQLPIPKISPLHIASATASPQASSTKASSLAPPLSSTTICVPPLAKTRSPRPPQLRLLPSAPASTVPSNSKAAPPGSAASAVDIAGAPSAQAVTRIRRVLFRDTVSVVGTDDVECAVEAPSTAGSPSRTADPYPPHTEDPYSPAIQEPRSPRTPSWLRFPRSPTSPATPPWSARASASGLWRRVSLPWTTDLGSSSTASGLWRRASAPQSPSTPTASATDPPTPRSRSSETIERIVAVYSASGHEVEEEHTEKGPRAHIDRITEQKRTSALRFPRPPGAAAFAPLDARLFSPSPRPPTWGSEVSDGGPGSGWVHADRLGWRDRDGRVGKQGQCDDTPRTPSGSMGVAEQFMRALVLDGRGARATVRTTSHSSFPLSAE